MRQVTISAGAWRCDDGATSREDPLDKPRHILVVIDPTATEHPAFERASRLARAFGARVELFVCHVQPGASVHVDTLRLESMVEQLRGMGIEATADESSAATLHVGIVRKVLSARPSLLIKDTHPHTLLRRTWLANTDWQMIRVCPCPVLLVRPGPWSEPARIAAAVDIALPGEKPAELDHALLDAAETFALASGVSLHAAHAYLPVSELAARATVAVVPMAAGVEPARVIGDREKMAREN